MVKGLQMPLSPPNILIKEQTYYMEAIFQHFADFGNTLTKHVSPYNIVMYLVKVCEVYNILGSRFHCHICPFLDTFGEYSPFSESCIHNESV